MYQHIVEHNDIDVTAIIEREMAPSEKLQKILKFLIIPRFLISKEKINRLSRDEELQDNFVFLVNNECLGHYNN